MTRAAAVPPDPENAPGRDPLSTAAALRIARAKIENPDRYVKGALAVDASGKPTRPHFPNAVRWSLDGALGADVQTRLYLTRSVGKPVFEFEEAAKTTHADVLALIDSAIKRLEAAHAAALAPAL